MFWKKRWKITPTRCTGYSWVTNSGRVHLMNRSGRLVGEIFKDRGSRLYRTTEDLGKFITLEGAQDALLHYWTTYDVNYDNAMAAMKPESVRVLECGGKNAVKEAHKLIQDKQSETWTSAMRLYKDTDIIGGCIYPRL